MLDHLAFACGSSPWWGDWGPQAVPRWLDSESWIHPAVISGFSLVPQFSESEWVA